MNQGEDAIQDLSQFVEEVDFDEIERVEVSIEEISWIFVEFYCRFGTGTGSSKPEPRNL